MKQIKLIRIALTCLALAMVSSVAQAQLYTNVLGNPGFELDQLGKFTNGFADVSYWADDGVNYVNTGIEPTGAHTGTYRMFEMVGDNGAYSIGTNTIPLAAGDLVILTWWALGTTASDPYGTNATDPEQMVGILTAPDSGASGVFDPFTSCAEVLVTSNGIPSGWTQYSLTYTATAADAGKYPGCVIDTGEVGGTITSNVFAAYDDFDLMVLPANNLPIIINNPVSQTAPPESSVTFSVAAVNATSYQWQGGVPGSGIYTNLLNAGQFSGVNSTNLSITGVTTNQNMDIVVVVSNGYGSVTNTPAANLTVAAIIYFDNMTVPHMNWQADTNPVNLYAGNVSVNEIGWMNDITIGYANRIFSNNHNITYPLEAIYSYNSPADNPEAFYGTVSTITGGPYPAGAHPAITNRMAFPGINLAVAQNVSFNVGMREFGGGVPNGFICVQMNFGNWYVSTNAIPCTIATFVTNSYKFNPTSNAWNNLTVSGTGSDSVTFIPVIGSAATNNLTGYITGIGLVTTRSGGYTLEFNNYTVLGAIPPSVFPVISSPPSGVTNYTGTTATFSVAANSNGVTSGLTYQWQTNAAGAGGGGTWGNLSNGGKYSGVTTPTLSIANVTTAANHKDYRVIVTDGAGSTTSGVPNGPEATLTVVDSAPIPVNAATIYPNDAPLFGATVVTNEAGNNNTLNFNASFTGTQPVIYRWQFNTQSNGTGAVNIPGATSATYTLPNPQVSNSGYYSLQASNSLSGSTPTNSAWVQLIILPSTNAVIHWSAPVVINGLTAAQILSPYGTYFEAELFNGASVNGGVIVTVTNGATIFSFDNTSVSATLVDVTAGLTAQYNGPSTGDPNLDLVLNTGDEIYSGASITLNNLTAGQLYTVQIFGINDLAGPSRQGNFSIPTDGADVSASFMFGDNVYMVGTFIATATTQVISIGQAGGGGYISSVIVRTLAGPPSPTIQWSGSNLLLNWPIGTLEQATNVAGPWTTNTATAPLTIAPTSPHMFFRVQVP